MQMIPIMTAFAQGKEIEVRRGARAEWCATDYVRFVDDYEYRIKPEPKLRPWKPEEVPVGTAIRFKANSGWRCLIVSAYNSRVIVGGRRAEFTTTEILEKFTLIDGSPCGVNEKS